MSLRSISFVADGVLCCLILEEDWSGEAILRFMCEAQPEEMQELRLPARVLRAVARKLIIGDLPEDEV